MDAQLVALVVQLSRGVDSDFGRHGAIGREGSAAGAGRLALGLLLQIPVDHAKQIVEPGSEVAKLLLGGYLVRCSQEIPHHTLPDATLADWAVIRPWEKI